MKTSKKVNWEKVHDKFELGGFIFLGAVMILTFIGLIIETFTIIF